MNSVLLLWRTVRHMRWRQIVYRIYYRFFKPQVRHIGVLPSRKWGAPSTWPAWHAQSVHPDGSCTFLNQTRRIQTPDDWNAAVWTKLWLYNLHYFDEVSATGAHDRRTQHSAWWAKWIAENPTGRGNGWEPYPTSLRIVNLVKWWSSEDETPSQEWVASFVLQVQWLNVRLEHHLLGNHLVANAKALVFAGAFLEGVEAEKWLAKGLDILDEQLPEQFLEDGAHFELSPMYHATMLWDLCELVHLSDRVPLPLLLRRRSAWVGLISQGMEWLQLMTHPDGDIAFFNDAAFCVAPALADLKKYADLCGVGWRGRDAIEFQQLWAKYCSHSGYARMESGAQSVLLADVARIGPDYLPGHAHADTLSFELSLYGSRVFVNSGTSVYGDGLERQRQRGTAAHNTVELDQQNSSEVWGGFRVGRRAYPEYVDIQCFAQAITLQAGHSGYRWLGAEHMRKWTLERSALTIDDQVQGASAVAYFHLHPDVKLELVEGGDGRTLRIWAHRKSIATFRCDSGNVSVEEGTWHPEFGRVIPNLCIKVQFKGGGLQTRIEW